LLYLSVCLARDSWLPSIVVQVSYSIFCTFVESRIFSVFVLFSLMTDLKFLHKISLEESPFLEIKLGRSGADYVLCMAYNNKIVDIS